MRWAVVGHVEWVAFYAVDGPVRPGAILHAPPPWEEPAGGGGVAAAELARLGGACTLFTGVGSDARGQGLAAAMAPLGVSVDATVEPGLHRRALTLVAPDGERSIVVVGDAQARQGLARADLAGFDGVYFCKGDADALRAARAARVLVVTARVLPVAQEAGVVIDALVGSAVDPSERYEPGDLQPPPRLVMRTEGAQGGRWWSEEGEWGRWGPAPCPEAAGDAYGCGDRFAAGLTHALASGLGAAEACAQAAHSGAYALGLQGAHGGKASMVG